MPEGPECRNFADWIRNRITKDATLVKVEAISGRYFRSGSVNLGSDQLGKVIDVGCKGKFIWIRMEGSKILCFTLGMTGGFSGSRWNFSRVKISYTVPACGEECFFFFNDIRNFGTVSLRDEDWWNSKLRSIGPDVIESTCAEVYARFLEARSAHPDRPIAVVMLDQSVVSGIGNYLRSEILHRASIDPRRPIGTLSDDECMVIAERCFFVRECYHTGGASLATYVNADGEKGGAKSLLRVYKKKVDEEGRPVTALDLDGRTVYFVESKFASAPS